VTGRSQPCAVPRRGNWSILRDGGARHEILSRPTVSVLPYAFGTHSGWVEACYDLGTAVLAPRTGYWTEQQRCHTFGWRPGEGPVREDVIKAVAEAYAARPVTPASRVERETQRQAVSAAHEQIYRAVFAAGTRHSAASA